jgi:tRNA 2-thiocytidine biosynthesis protein TtcA
MFTALQNIVPSHLLDSTQFDFKSVAATGMEEPDGDIAFDAITLPKTAAPAVDVVSHHPLAPLSRPQTMVIQRGKAKSSAAQGAHQP